MEKGQIYIGCSGWNYNHWRGVFYPGHLKGSQWFSYYVKSFMTVEINNTFYNLPKRETFKQWKRQAPPNFIYAVKANKYITHMKKLKETKQALERFLARASELGEHLGPILYQLPPYWRLNLERLEGFLDSLPQGLTHVFEFRHQSWMVEEVFELLERRGAAYCAHDMPGLAIPRLCTGNIAYIRFHGVINKYCGAYSESSLYDWHDWMRLQTDKGKEVFAYFNNDAGGQAVRDALLLKEINKTEYLTG